MIRRLPVFVCFLLLSVTARAGSVRDIRLSPSGVLWAVGDGGLLLASEDDGATWQGRSTDLGAHLRQLWIEEPRVWAFGGRAVGGYPGGAGRAVVLRSEDGGKTFDDFPAGPVGWACGGAASGDSVVLAGQPTPRAPGGVFHTRSGGRRYTAIELDTEGYLQGAAFRDLRYGYFVGENLKIVSLRNLMQPELHPAEIPGTLPLTAADFSDRETCWAIGHNGVVVQSRPAGQRWPLVTLPLPPGTRSLADFETVDFLDARHGLIGGGLTGLIFRTTDGGRRFALIDAPGPGPIRCLRHLGAEELLAGGDGGRIWRSRDGGETWQQLRGPKRTDVLFVVAAGDMSIYPAIVAHAQAGLDVAVVYVSAPSRPDNSADMGRASIPPGQQLRAAAALAGAGGAVVFEDLPSLLLDPQATENADAQTVLARWSAALDAPAEPIVLRRIAAAIRLYQPRVVATGPAGEGSEGLQAENRLVARLAGRAVEMAAAEDAPSLLAQARLAPHRIERLFVGMDGNETWQAPWGAPPEPMRDAHLRIDATRWPEGADATIELLAQRAIWAIGAAGLLERPARFSGYRCEQLDAPVALMTAGLLRAALSTRSLTTRERLLSTASQFRLAESTGRVMTLLPDILAALAEDEHMGYLGADRLAMVWSRLRAQGRLVEAEEARRLFMRHGGAHPLYQRLSVTMLAEWSSQDFQALWASLGAPAPMDSQGRALSREDLGRAARGFGDWEPWSRSPVGTLLAARAMAAAGLAGQAFDLLDLLEHEAYPHAWRELAGREIQLWRGKLPVLQGNEWIEAEPAPAEGRIDGRLDETAWAKARPHPLKAGNAQSGEATLQILRTPADVVFGLRLPKPPGREWQVELAIDADRDAQTQFVLSFDDAGQMTQQLRTRNAPPAELPQREQAPPMSDIGSWVLHARHKPPKTFFCIEATRQVDGGWWTVEIGLPLQYVQNPAGQGVWGVQVCATASDAEASKTFYLRPQPDPQLLPERYGLLLIPAPSTPSSAEPDDPATQPAPAPDDGTEPKELKWQTSPQPRRFLRSSPLQEHEFRE
jgi:photosystem II stability/assembly factor-like uncharacterized protein